MPVQQPGQPWGDQVSGNPWPAAGQPAPGPITSVPFGTEPERPVAPGQPTGVGPLAEIRPQPSAPEEERALYGRPSGAEHNVPDDGTRIVPRVGSRAPDQGWTIALDDGRYIKVASLVLIGRNPQPRAGEENAELVKVGEGARTVSKTHLAVGVDNRGIYVSDRGSTNGSAIANANGDYEPCQPGEIVRVREGQIVSFGEHRLEIQRAYS